MKKLMSILAASLIVGGAQAASVSWGNVGGSSGLYGLDGTTKITAANATAWGLTVTLMHLDGTPTTGSTSSINSMTPGQLQNATWTYTFGKDATTGDQFYLHAVMKVDNKDYEMDIGKDSPFTLTAVNNTGTDTFSWAAGTYGGTMWKESTPDEPEPTSALLMLCGLAGLALRRKRA